ncbi:Uncharacterised protein [Escherichia coli]|uniref:Uncharacterized protein n=1 Tax=Escherichia coli TaxID=562 RepID=A0A376RHE6_ECOLX|nr:Uncharacterised protein [Escherichia coli]
MPAEPTGLICCQEVLFRYSEPRNFCPYAATAAQKRISSEGAFMLAPAGIQLTDFLFPAGISSESLTRPVLSFCPISLICYPGHSVTYQLMPFCPFSVNSNNNVICLPAPISPASTLSLLNLPPEVGAFHNQSDGIPLPHAGLNSICALTSFATVINVCRISLFNTFCASERGINVAVVAVTNIGNSHHHCLVVIAIPHAKRRQSNTRLPLFFDH